MSELWKIHNFVTGTDEPIRVDHTSPTNAWVEGWSAYMIDGYKNNPYTIATPEHNDYEDGWQSAEGD